MTLTKVSKEFELTLDTLRYYEKVGLIPGVNHTLGEIGDYHEEVHRRMEYFKCMRRAGFPIDTLIAYMKMFPEDDGTIEDRNALLVE